MSNLMDCMREVLRDSGFTGNLNDSLIRYYQSHGATSSNLNTAARQFLEAQGAPVGTLGDMWRAYLDGQGYLGALNDQLRQFWCSGGAGGGGGGVPLPLAPTPLINPPTGDYFSNTTTRIDFPGNGRNVLSFAEDTNIEIPGGFDSQGFAIAFTVNTPEESTYESFAAIGTDWNFQRRAPSANFQLRLTVQGNTGDFGFDLPANETHHLRVVYDGADNASLYVDGELNSVVSGLGPYDPGVVTMHLGGPLSWSNRFVGIMRDFAVYDSTGRMVRFYPIDEGSGTTIYDTISGLDGTLTLGSGSWTTDTQPRGVLAFVHDTGVDLPGGFGDQGFGVSFDVYTTEENNYLELIGIDEDWVIRRRGPIGGFGLRLTVLGNQANFAYQLPTNEEHHIRVLYDGVDGASLYVDGVFQETVSGLGPYDPGTRPMVVGGPWTVSSVNRFIGRFKNVGIHNANGGLMRLYPIDEGSGTVIHDTVGGLDGTLTLGGGVWGTEDESALFKVYYTMDGSTPNENSTLYTGPFDSGTHPVTIKARVFRPGYTPSQQDTAVYTPPPGAAPSPVISPPSGVITKAQLITITTSANPPYDIRYTLDGSMPTELSPLYMAPFTLAQDTQVSARVFKGGYQPSNPVSEAYTIAKSVAPQFIPGTGRYPISQTITIQDSTSGRFSDEIYYRLNGGAWTQYTAPLTLAVGQWTIDAYTVTADYADSDIVSAVYDMYDPANAPATLTLDFTLTPQVPH